MTGPKMGSRSFILKDLQARFFVSADSKGLRGKEDKEHPSVESISGQREAGSKEAGKDRVRSIRHVSLKVLGCQGLFTV